MRLFPELSQSWYESDLQKLIDYRKQLSLEEEEQHTLFKTLNNEEKKLLGVLFKTSIRRLQKQIKAVSILLDYFYGRGRFQYNVRESYFPEELREYFENAFWQMSKE